MKVPLHERERVIVSSREHSRVLRAPIAAFLILTALSMFVLGYLSRPDLSSWLADNAGLWQLVTVVLWAALTLIWCVAPWVRWMRSRIVLTTERILFRSSLNPSKLQSIGLYTVRDLVAYAKQKNSTARPGTLDVILGHGYVRLTHIPAVGYFRSLAIEAMTALQSSIPTVDTTGFTNEGRG